MPACRDRNGGTTTVRDADGNETVVDCLACGGNGLIGTLADNQAAHLRHAARVRRSGTAYRPPGASTGLVPRFPYIGGAAPQSSTYCTHG
ncbi:hypothetical protein GCM10010277_84140 [Streptomyces longisporoflavus]|nr:hypothetical protein GCM10010277_84140 [Streptomyces longisporoflavus]